MNTKNVLVVALCLCSSFFIQFSVQAQTTIWGFGSSNGQAAGEFQNNFIPVTTAGNYSLTDWTARSISHSNSTVIPGAAFWTRSTTGISQGGFAVSIPTIGSFTASNGSAIFDSDFMDNGGDPNSPGSGAAPAAQRGELISPRMDLSAAANSAIVLAFHSYYRYSTLNELSVAISSDDGLTWTTIDVQALQTTAPDVLREGRVRISLPDFTTGVLNLSQCRLKFTFDGDLYFWMLDDVAVQVAPNYDIAIGTPDPNAFNLFAVGNLIRMGGNAYQAYENIDFANPLTWSWGAKVVNRGARNLPPSLRPRLYCSVSAKDLATGIVTPTIYQDSIIATDTLFAMDTDGIPIEKDMTAANITFLQSQLDQTRIEYTVRYWAAQDGIDGNGFNDTTEHSFIVGRDDAGVKYLSKAGLAPDGRVTARTYLFPTGGPYAAYEFGSVYYFPFGSVEDLKIDSIDFRYYLSNDFSGASTQTIYAKVYEYRDGVGGNPADGRIQDTELSAVIIALETLTGLSTSINTVNGHLLTFDNPVNIISGGLSPTLSDNTFYYVSVLVQPDLAGGNSSFDFDDVPLHGVDGINYAMNMGKTTSTAPFAPSTIFLTDPSGVRSGFAGYAGYSDVPSIGIFFSTDILSTNKLKSQLQGTLQLYPNPAQEQLQVEVVLSNPTDVQYIITDVTGRVVYLDNSTNISQEVATIDVSNLISGVYMITIRADEGVLVKRFVKQ